MSCVAGLDLVSISSGSAQQGSDGVQETTLSYGATVYTDQDVDVSCMAGAGTVASADAHFYPNTVNGASSGACIVNLDLPPLNLTSSGNAGIWAFSFDKTGPLATYMDADAGHPLDGYVHEFADAECNSLILDTDLAWKSVTLAAVFSKR